MLTFGEKFWQISYGYEDPFEISSHEHRLPWKKCTDTPQLEYEDFYNSNIVRKGTNDFFHLWVKKNLQFLDGFKGQIIKLGNPYCFWNHSKSVWNYDIVFFKKFPNIRILYWYAEKQKLLILKYFHKNHISIHRDRNKRPTKIVTFSKPSQIITEFDTL